VCEDWVARVVSVQGRVEARGADSPRWVPVALDDRYCLGDTIHVHGRSRAAVLLRNDAVLRLDQNTTVTFSGPKEEASGWIELLRGAAHFVSRIPRRLRVVTPFVNGSVEGTEFAFEVGPDQAVLTVLAGRVSATNPLGSLTVTTDQSAVARAGQPPVSRVVARPMDAVQWALYYASVVDPRTVLLPVEAPEEWQAVVRRSVRAYLEGDLAGAFASLEALPAALRGAGFFTYRAALLLTVGRVEEARADIGQALARDAAGGDALALRSVIAVAQGERDEGLRLARQAVSLDPRSAGARLALSYAQQAHFDLVGALATVREAVARDPDNSLAWARLAELWLSFREVDQALEAAERAARLSRELSRTQTVLGFAYLAQLRTREARGAFERAIALDPADPLPRLGLGLARIREGDLEAGRRELDIAASLDPGNSLVRSYLGKAYYEEKRDELAAEQFGIARKLDPLDPTPWFYDAIRKQSGNRPVEALGDLERALELNDNRAVYRSRLLLDEDLAARSASLARLYDEVGFQQLALAEGWKSLARDPANYSAHRVLADSYSVLPRHEIARVSELLQSQLLQPLNINPIQPQLGAGKLFILQGAGPAATSFNEFNPLFERNRLALLASGVAGGLGTRGDVVVQSGLGGPLAYSLGQFHYETQGFRENADLRQDIYTAFVQASLSHRGGIQAEYRDTRFDRGDLILRFDRDNFLPTLRQRDHVRFLWVGVRHESGPGSDLILSFGRQWGTFDTTFGSEFGIFTEEEGLTFEGQHLFRSPGVSLVSGAGHASLERRDEETGFEPVTSRTRVRHNNLYAYLQLTLVKDLVLTIGGSGDLFRGGVVDRDQVNPKLGLTWSPVPSTTFRAALFRTFKRTLLSSQTIEPTQVAGFNQFFDDAEGTDAWRYGVGIDQRVRAGLYAGAEFSWRDLRVPVEGPGMTRLGDIPEREELGRGYLYWAPVPSLALTAEYLYERLDRDPEASNPEGIAKVRTHRFPLGVSVFDPSGLGARLKATYVDQGGRFADSLGEIVAGDDRFWVVDGAVTYRLPRRWGIIGIEARNLLNQRFRLQETDPVTPSVARERLILGRLTLAY
jgi:tetratricopeptide (TPR) repeat protein